MKSVRVLSLLLLTFVCAASRADDISSPALRALKTHMDGRDDAQELDAFWTGVAKAGTPMIEPVAGEPTQMFVTFLWRDRTGKDKLDLGVFGVFNSEPWKTGDPLVRLPGTDVWYRTYQLNAALRAPYMLIGADGRVNGAKAERTWPDTDEQGNDKDFDLSLDPLNSRTIDDVYYVASSRESYFEGPDVPPENWRGAQPAPLRGKTVELKVASKILGNERKVVVYLPPAQALGKDKPGFVLLFDGLSYITPGRVPEMLDHLITAGEIAPMAGVFVDYITQDHRQKELAPNDPFTRFMAEELVPLLRKKFNLSSDPAKAIIGGASRGGLAANFIALKHPEIFGNVIGQSSALWWGPSKTERDTNWLAREYQAREKLPIRFYLQAGTLERPEGMKTPNRFFRDVLVAKGYDVTYREFIGGHNFLNWRTPLPDALIKLAPGAKRRAALEIKNVTVIDPESEKATPDQNVYVDGGKIIAITPAGNPGNWIVEKSVDGANRYLLPGFMDMHVHLASTARQGYSRRLFVANGVTGVRDMASDCWIPTEPGELCIPDMRKMQEAVEDGDLVGPRLLRLASFPVDGPVLRGELPKGAPLFYLPATEDEGRQLVRYAKERGVDLLKVYNSIPRAAYAGIAAETKALGLEFSGHVPDAIGAVKAAEMGQRTIEHARGILFDCGTYGPGYREVMSHYADQEKGAKKVKNEERVRQTLETYDAARCAAVAKALKDNGTYYVPTHKTREMDARASEAAYRSDARLRYMPQDILKDWSGDLDSTAAEAPKMKTFYDRFLALGLTFSKMASDAGVKMMVGTDANDTMIIPGFSFHDELVFYAQAGIPNMKILKAATATAAQYLGRADLGGVAVGKTADLVLLDADPLAEIANTSKIAAVLIGGHIHDRAALDRLLGDVEKMSAAH